jgi:hypothetical protein
MESKTIMESRTVWVGLAMGVVPVLLQYLAGINWASVLPPEYAGLVAGAIMIAMRLVTTVPVERSK